MPSPPDVRRCLFAVLTLAMVGCAGKASGSPIGPEAPPGEGEPTPPPSGTPDGGDLGPSTCTVRPQATPTCVSGAWDAGLRRCASETEVWGPFPPSFIASCAGAGGGAACSSDRWARGLYEQVVDVTGLKGETLAEVLDGMRARDDVYCLPNEQDLAGRGIFPRASELGGVDGRSERTYPAFVLGPRRQTDSLVRQLVRLLPTSVADATAFAVADRLAQNPEAFTRPLAARSRVVLVGSFVGIGSATTLSAAARARHERELYKLRASIALVHSLGKTVGDVVYAMGDSSSAFGASVRASLQARFSRTLTAAGLGALGATVTWGADEAAAVAIARQLPSKTVRVRYENELAQHHYDGMKTTREIVREKLLALRMRDVTFEPGVRADIDVAVLDRRPGGAVNDYQSGDVAQKVLDDAFLAPVLAATPEERSRLAIVDGRLFNGAWDSRAAPPQCDLLAYGAWGTFGNVFGSTLASAAIVQSSNNPAARRQLYLEAVAHDVFANGYAEAQRGGLRTKVDARLGAGTFKHFEGYPDAATTSTVFEVLNGHVNLRMAEHFASTSCLGADTFRFTPQLWRTFESEVHIRGTRPGEVFAPGVFRQDLAAGAFDPHDGRPVSPATQGSR